MLDWILPVYPILITRASAAAPPAPAHWPSTPAGRAAGNCEQVPHPGHQPVVPFPAQQDHNRTSAGPADFGYIAGPQP